MNCPRCGGGTIVVPGMTGIVMRDHYETRRRRRECLKCFHRFTTFEIHADDMDRLYPVNRHSTKTNGKFSRATCTNSQGVV
jgi:transcriptional regulator NrdR family protein